MERLTEHQFHCVWTMAVGEKGYNKKLFQKVLEKMKKRKLIVSSWLALKEIQDYGIQKIPQ